MVAIDTARTDDQGRFTLWLLPGTEHEVKASAAGYSEAKRPGVSPGADEADLGTLTLTSAHLAISGRVTDLDGKPLGGVRVGAWGETQNSIGRSEVLTDAQGRYRLENLAAGKVQLDVQGGDRGFEFREVEAGASGVDLVLLPEQGRDALPAKPRLKPGDAAPEITALRPLNGGRIPSLQALRGRIVLLQFATPHNPAGEACGERLHALQRKYARAGLTLVTLYDASLPAAETAAYLKRRGVTSPAAIVPSTPQLGWNSAPFKRYGVRAVPALFLIDRSGRVRAVGSSVAELEPAIERLARSR
jgi:peroxiredoxin